MRIRNSVVVITGASSGIGRATALAFARKGARLAITARREEKLEEVARECAEQGAECLAITCDITDEQDVQALADEVFDEFGGIDVWVNNAGTTAFGRIDEMPYAVYRQVIDTNLFGYIHGARAAVSHFRRQGKGILINVSSIAGKIGHPFVSAYCASKFGIIGLSDSLRTELRHEPEIHVCTVLPVGTDTPLFQHGANYYGQEARPPSPVYSPEQVARVIVGCARSPRREVAVGWMGKFMNRLHGLAPGFAEQMLARKVEQEHFMTRPAPQKTGNVFSPVSDEYGTTGGWMEYTGGPPHKTRGLLALVTLGAGLLGGVIAWRFAQSVASRQAEYKPPGFAPAATREPALSPPAELTPEAESALPLDSELACLTPRAELVEETGYREPRDRDIESGL
jgi:NAD(P)-dependent dehydrogenase (short-subunit alcohol dehydrogenase family)